MNLKGYYALSKPISKFSMVEMLKEYTDIPHIVVVKGDKSVLYLKKNNKLRRKEDKKLLNKLSMEDLILLNMPRKVEGIPILDMISKRL